MTPPADRAAIEAHLHALGIDDWPPLTSGERDLVRRALAPDPPVSPERARPASPRPAA